MANGATVIVLGLPRDWLFGFDLMRWGVGDRLTGITEIPTGVHYIYCSPGNELGVCGEFLEIDESDILVFRFDVAEERLKRDEVINLDSLMSDPKIGSGLAPFHRVIERVEDWQQLCKFVGREVLLNGQKFSAIENFVFPLGSTPAEITKYSMDKSAHLNQIIQSRNYANSSSVLGEIQCAFIGFLLGQNYDALMHWRGLVELFLQCGEDGIRDHMGLFIAFVDVIEAELGEIPSEILTNVDTDGRIFLVRLIAQFIEECSAISEMHAPCWKLNQIMADKFDGDQEWAASALEEDEPIVVVEHSI